MLATSSLTEGFALLPAGNFVAYDSALQGRMPYPPAAALPLATTFATRWGLPSSAFALRPIARRLLVKPTGKLAAVNSSTELPDGGLYPERPVGPG